MIAHILFTWIQGAQFYKDVHQQAVELLPPENGQWLDVGCGPGLVSRQAALRGYRVSGIDSNERMIVAAKRLAKRQSLAIDFRVGSVFDLRVHSADVVSAASLLAVLDDKQRGLQCLWNAVKPGGTLLLVEPTEKMNPENARRLLANGLPSKRSRGILLWAKARENRAVPELLYNQIGAQTVTRYELLGGLVAAWLLCK
jgi:2-polyprenyl-3-methyl-5-hydroxy-6-metoxy-1,4-benzoquinol methylase